LLLRVCFLSNILLFFISPTVSVESLHIVSFFYILQR
jgi:hypothetical protein